MLDAFDVMLFSLLLASIMADLNLTKEQGGALGSITLVAAVPFVLVVNPSLPANSVSELVKLAKAKPGFLNYASAGIGSFQNLGGELFKVLAGVNIVHVPYKGGGPSMLAVIAGEAQMMFSSIVQTVSNI